MEAMGDSTIRRAAVLLALLLADAARGAPVPILFDQAFSGVEPIVGVWEFVADPEAPRVEVRGDRWEAAPEAGAAAKLNRIFKGLPESVLDQVRAYYYFPLALVRQGEFSDGTLRVEVRPVSGEADRAGGIAFGMASPSSYWVLRLNAREDNVMLFEYVKAHREARHLHRIALQSGRWYALAAGVRGKRLKAWLDGALLFEYDLPAPVRGRYGLWSKADSRASFRRFTVDAAAPAGRAPRS